MFPLLAIPTIKAVIMTITDRVVGEIDRQPQVVSTMFWKLGFAVSFGVLIGAAPPSAMAWFAFFKDAASRSELTLVKSEIQSVRDDFRKNDQEIRENLLNQTFAIRQDLTTLRADVQYLVKEANQKSRTP